MTKREFAEAIVDNFCLEENVERQMAHERIYASSRLAVALEFLGELNENEKEYSKQRGGIEYQKVIQNPDGTFNSVHFLTTRDILALLPDKVEE